MGLVRDADNIIRCTGRFQDIETAPKLLPKNNHFTDLIIKYYHENLLHAGVSQTLSEIRMKFWIVKGRAAVKRVLKNCLRCKFWEGKSFKTLKFAPIPKLAKTINQPFSCVGLDYLGPIKVRNKGDLMKNWICLFTCITVRAVHLEIVESLNTEQFLMSLRRFIGRRGKPEMIICDNAKQFKLGEGVVDQIWKCTTGDDEVQSYVANKGISWKFIVDYSPWTGGFYERLIGLTKSALKRRLGRTR